MSHFAKGLPSQDVWYRQLIDAKTNIDTWRNMSAEAILRYDFKVFTSVDGKLSVGISSILCSVDDFVAKPGWQDALSKKNKAGGYYYYMVLPLLITDGGTKTKRQQLFFSDEKGRVADASAFFHKQTDYDYKLKGPIEITDDPVQVIAYDQLNAGLSRKAVGPTSIQFLESEDKL